MKFPQMSTALLTVALSAAMAVQAGPREEAKRIHDRLAGVPPTEAELIGMAEDIQAGDAQAAAYTAMSKNSFYAVTLKNMFTPATNRDGDVFRDFNDYVATVIGLVRDDADFRTALYDNVIYVGADSLNLPAYANNNNNHYRELFASGANLITGLERKTQTAVTGLEDEATAGLMTTRAAAKAFFIAGTNRAMFRFTLMNHLCMDLEQVHDITRTPDRIRQDVSRSPGGDSRVFNNNCIGCHSGMDPMAQAFAYYNYQYDADNDLTGENGQLVYNSAGELDPDTGTRVQAKYHINSTTFPYGFVTPDDQWENYWREGQNKLLGWDDSLPGSGSGAKTMGMELAHSEAFAQCQVKKVFKTVCLREPGDADDRTAVSNMVASFKASNYKLKQVFAESAEYCLTD
ncbi:hypothetical protein L1F30_17260 [Simiduia sp. 21SJ11W-1]|uniref:hypothetical protein n=1 Tax=Simiduia sp. 21SJ11W-1 TaxID=2909669 RepID=UPI0020A1D851|nr:hypothetical protein [Simiduia sp. 21SJ11W-1]UTA47890.1 hypothetical protein L1F30_17260 [Simiduia sp. 21SJ11W-1]